ncbi:MAG: SIMPL domain-containing protein [Bacteroidales bacterium]|nr:SIMPL domain-containing protein [Bacteroidales bacterium]
MKTGIIILSLILSAGMISAQESMKTPKYIEVTGSAEMEVEPDEVIFVIEVQEYWEEEFEKNSEFKDYKTKVPIAKIEKELMEKLAMAGVREERIVIREVGNSWRYFGKEFLINKQIELSLNDLNMVNSLVQSIDARGVKSMKIGELKNVKLTTLRKQVKIEAVKAAREKAEYLLGSIDEELGGVLQVEELETQQNPWWLREQNLLSNVAVSSPDNNGIENLRTIKLRYEIKARFEIL